MIAVDVSALADGPGGIPSVVRGLAQAMQSRGDDVAFIARGYRPPFRPRAELDQVAAVDAVTPRPPRQVWLQLIVPALLRRLRADVFISPAFVTPAAAPCKTVTIVHDATPFNAWRRKGIREGLLRSSIRHTLANADTVVFPSQSVLDEFKALNLLRCRKHAVVVHWGVDERFLRSDRAGGSGVVWAGSTVPRKDWQTMESAAALAGIHDLELLGPGITGGGGYFGDVLRTLTGAEALVVTSHYEGFSLPIVEARALGLPVVCTDIPVHREVASVESTWFFAPGDTSALAEILQRRPWAHGEHRRSWDRTWTDVANDLITAVGGEGGIDSCCM